jgi:hypothetical protein
MGLVEDSASFCGTPNLTYAPASEFCVETASDFDGLFTVTGDASSVPEPTTMVLLPSGLLANGFAGHFVGLAPEADRPQI